MELLNELNEIGELKFKQYKLLKDLELNIKYKILKLEKIKGKFGYQIVAELQDFKVNLPKRFLNVFDDKKIKEFNKLENIHLIVTEIKIIKEKECVIVKFE